MPIASQEKDQTQAASLYKFQRFVQFACCIFILKAVRTSMYGRPGACYVDISGDMVNALVERKNVRFVFTLSIVFYSQIWIV